LPRPFALPLPFAVTGSATATATPNDMARKNIRFNIKFSPYSTEITGILYNFMKR
jgi:hypothetical protein